LSVNVSVSRDHFGSNWKNVVWICYLKTLPKTFEKIHVKLKSIKSKEFFRQRQNIFISISRCICLRKIVSERQSYNKYFYVQYFRFWESFRLWDNVDKCGTARKRLCNYIIYRIRFACWLHKFRDTQTETNTKTFTHTHTHTRRICTAFPQ
jgi:hypothetical protein